MYNNNTLRDISMSFHHVSYQVIYLSLQNVRIIFIAVEIFDI